MAPTDIELEKGIRGTKLRGSIDALYQDIVFEFCRSSHQESRDINRLKVNGTGKALYLTSKPQQILGDKGN